MNRIMTLFAVAAAAAGLSSTKLPAQTREQVKEQARENPDLFRAIRDLSRNEIILPDIDGYKTLKTDLHVHTYFSDGDCSPEYRVREAWRDGLDALTISDHIEYRPHDGGMAGYLGVRKGKKTDLNASVRMAEAQAQGYGVLVIPGIEITRSPREVGHFNALFTTDNNKIPDDDPLVAIRNAKAQNAIVQFNHPGWARNDANFTETATKAMEEGMINGIEAFNGEEFYPKSIEDAVNNNCYVAGNSDIHATIHDFYLRSGYYRNMTIIFAKERSLESIKEALLAQRTIAYGCGTLAGTEEMLKKFFLASMEFKVVNVDDNGRKSILITNKTSFPYLVKTPESSVNVLIPAMSTIRMRLDKDKELDLTVSNMFYGVDKNIGVSIKL